MYQFTPGHILQLMYLKKRMRSLPLGQFLEIGAGTGYISNLLLKTGFSGIGVDLNSKACAINSKPNNEYISNNKYKVLHGNFLDISFEQKFDIIISSMVIEHLEQDDLNKYFHQAKKQLKESGVLICLVPASPKDWGIEDDIAGHVKRYTFEDIYALCDRYGLKVQHITGLTYPVSNFLLPVSNYLVNRTEKKLLSQSMAERTIASGNRSVPMKTSFPWWTPFIINSTTMFPFYLLQRIFSKHPRSLVIYAEFKLH